MGFVKVLDMVRVEGYCRYLGMVDVLAISRDFIFGLRVSLAELSNV